MSNEELKQQFLNNFPYSLIDNHLKDFGDKIKIRGEDEELVISLKNALAVVKIENLKPEETWKDGYKICGLLYDIYYQRRNIDIIVCSEDMKNFTLKARIDGYFLFETPLTDKPRFII